MFKMIIPKAAFLRSPIYNELIAWQISKQPVATLTRGDYPPNYSCVTTTHYGCQTTQCYNKLVG